MPSDDPVSQPDPVLQALAALRAPVTEFRSAVAGAEEDLRGMLIEPSADADGRGLGVFAAGRIDFSRFSGVVSRASPLDPLSRDRLRAAHEMLRLLSEQPAEALFVVRVPAGGSFRDTVNAGLAAAGRAFGAAHVAAAVRRSESAERDAEMLRAYPFAAWNARERLIAPPLVVVVDGADLRAGDLAEFLDGVQKIVVVVQGACAPAAFVRLVTPGAWVAQVPDASGLAGLASWPGAGVAAIVPDGAALFTHDPRGGNAPWQRLSVARVPAEAGRRTVGPWTAEQQAEEMRQLAALALEPPVTIVAAAPVAEAAAPAEPVDPAGRLAAWLLDAAGLEVAR